MTQERKMRVVGWAIVMLLGISMVFFREELSVITTGWGNTITLSIATFLIFFEDKGKSQKIRVMRLAGWVFINIFGFLIIFHKEEFSLITSGVGGLVCICICGYLLFFGDENQK